MADHIRGRFARNLAARRLKSLTKTNQPYSSGRFIDLLENFVPSSKNPVVIRRYLLCFDVKLRRRLPSFIRRNTLKR